MFVWSKKWLLVLSFFLPILYHAHATAAIIKEVPSVRGPMQLVENEQLNSFLVFPQEKRQLALNGAWRDTNIEYVTQIRDQTAVVIAYSEAKCSSRQALIVVTPRGIWGPYQLGGCEDTLIYQLSESRDSFVVLSPRNAMAWVYTANDERFRGPARIDLPEQLRQFVPKGSTSTTSTPPVTEQPIQKRVPSPSASDTALSAAPPSATSTSNSPASPPQRQNPAPPRSPRFSAADASVVADKVEKTTKPQPKLVIDLMM